MKVEIPILGSYDLKIFNLPSMWVFPLFMSNNLYTLWSAVLLAFFPSMHPLFLCIDYIRFLYKINFFVQKNQYKRTEKSVQKNGKISTSKIDLSPVISRGFRFLKKFTLIYVVSGFYPLAPTGSKPPAPPIRGALPLALQASPPRSPLGRGQAIFPCPYRGSLWG